MITYTCISPFNLGPAIRGYFSRSMEHFSRKDQHFVITLFVVALHIDVTIISLNILAVCHLFSTLDSNCICFPFLALGFGHIPIDPNYLYQEQNI